MAPECTSLALLRFGGCGGIKQAERSRRISRDGTQRSPLQERPQSPGPDVAGAQGVRTAVPQERFPRGPPGERLTGPRRLPGELRGFGTRPFMWLTMKGLQTGAGLHF